MLVVPSAGRSGGGDVWLEQLIQGLADFGAAPAVVFENHGQLIQSAASAGCETHVLPQQRPVDETGLSSLIRPLADIMSGYQPDATVFWSPRAQLYGSRAHASAGQPGRTAWVQHVMSSSFWLHRDASHAPTDLVVCVSSAVDRRQRALYPHSVTAVVHPGIAPRPSGLSRAEARKLLGWHGSGYVIGVVGRVEPWKGQDIAVRMLHALVGADAGCHLVLLGENRSPTWPEFGGAVEELASELGVGDRVRFAGHRSDVTDVLPAFDVLVCSSREEGFGLAIVEAMTAGVPVVATRCGGPEDIVEHGVNGLLVPAESHVALADAVLRLLNRPDIGRQLAHQARLSCATRFTATSSAAAFQEVIASLAVCNRDVAPGPAL